MPSKYIIRDLVCLTCDTEIFNQMVLSKHELPVLHPCAKCKKDTEHGDQGTNSGGGIRYRCNDHPTAPGSYRGQIKAKNFSVTYTDDKGVVHDERDVHTGEKMAEKARFSGDATAERQDRLYREQDAAKGKTPLHIDQKKKG